MNSMYDFFKRCFDLLFAVLFLIVFSPVYLLTFIIIKIVSPGPAIYKAKRVGKDGKLFNCYKFRSMHVNKDADKIQATADDPRKFSFGNLMRKTNLDEFPQFFNVLKGDMSIVGPRPVREEVYYENKENIPFWECRKTQLSFFSTCVILHDFLGSGVSIFIP